MFWQKFILPRTYFAYKAVNAECNGTLVSARWPAQVASDKAVVTQRGSAATFSQGHLQASCWRMTNDHITDAMQ